MWSRIKDLGAASPSVESAEIVAAATGENRNLNESLVEPLGQARDERMGRLCSAEAASTSSWRQRTGCPALKSVLGECFQARHSGFAEPEFAFMRGEAMRCAKPVRS